MKEDLDGLRELVPPPARPQLGDQTWEWLFTRLGSRLPADYVEFMETYGGGAWAGWLRLWAPLDAGDMGLAACAGSLLGAERQARAEFPHHYRLPLYPEPGGYLPFGDSIDGDRIGWLTSGSPDEWQLVLMPRHEDEESRLSGSLAGTVLQWLSGRLKVAGLYRFDKDELAEAATFRVWGT